MRHFEIFVWSSHPPKRSFAVTFSVLLSENPNFEQATIKNAGTVMRHERCRHLVYTIFLHTGIRSCRKLWQCRGTSLLRNLGQLQVPYQYHNF